MIYLEEEGKFNELVKEGDVLVDFSASWCGPCQMLEPVLEEFSEHFTYVKVIKVDVDECENLAREHGIMSVPTLEIYKDGLLTKKEIGFHTMEEIAAWFVH